MGEPQRWSVEQVAAVAPSPNSLAAAEPLAVASRWSALGTDARAIWGRCSGSSAEPYDTAVDHVGLRWRCSCPSRKLPCKHALALLLLWVRGGVPAGAAPERVAAWIARRSAEAAAVRADAGASAAAAAGATATGAAGSGSDSSRGERSDGESSDEATPPDRDELDRARDERIARMREGLTELDRWLEDRLRTGLSDPALARYATWDQLAARLVDARAGSLANRVRRLAGLVGAGPQWHADVLAEIGLLHLIAQGGRRIPDLPGELADAVAAASGWQVKQADVLAGVPETDEWLVAGRSDTREDRIEVRRWWLLGADSRHWAMLLSFAAYRQSLDDSFEVGTVVHADLHRYPGGSLRALVGERHADPIPLRKPSTGSVADACEAIGRAVAAEPWLERFPAMLRAAPTVLGGCWVLSDETGSLPLVGEVASLAPVVAASGGRALDMTIEWTPRGVSPLAVHLRDRVLDVGPRADPDFVGAA